MSASCPNCGHSHFKDSEHCEKCGYLAPKLKQLSDSTLIMCTECGCHYLDSCASHGTQFLQKVKK